MIDRVLHCASRVVKGVEAPAVVQGEEFEVPMGKELEAGHQVMSANDQGMIEK